jgi:hypothetical protein
MLLLETTLELSCLSLPRRALLLLQFNPTSVPASHSKEREQVVTK